MTGKAQTGTRQLLRRCWLTLTKWRSLSVLCVLTLAVSLIVNACSVAPQQLPPLRVGISSWAGYDIALYAQETGLFKKYGLDVQLVRFENQQDSTRAMLRGNLDANFASLWDVVQSDSGSDKPAVLMVTNISHGADGIVAQTAIESVANLRGKRVGAKLGTVNHLILLEALKLHQIKPEEVKIEDISNETAVDLMQQRRLDAAAIWQPLLGETAQSIKGNIIFTTFKQVDIHEGIDSTLLILQHRLQARLEHPEIKVIRDYGDLPLVECYAGQLNQVFMNILANAIDALEAINTQQVACSIEEKPCCITISTSVVDSQWVKIAIGDNGNGIPESI